MLEHLNLQEMVGLTSPWVNDPAVKNTFLSISEVARKPPDLARAERAEQTSAALFPSGMAIVNASLLAESGNVERVATLLERQPELAAFLDEIPVRGGTLLALTKRWIAAGKRLGKLEVDDTAAAVANVEASDGEAAADELGAVAE